MNFVKLNAYDPHSEDPALTNAIFIRHDSILHIESWSGPFAIIGYAPNGTCMATGKSKMIINASIIMLNDRSTRVVSERPEEILEKIASASLSLS